MQYLSKKSRYILLAFSSAILLAVGCAQESRVEEREYERTALQEQQLPMIRQAEPEEIKVNISLKDQREASEKKEVVSAESAPLLSNLSKQPYGNFTGNLTGNFAEGCQDTTNAASSSFLNSCYPGAAGFAGLGGAYPGAYGAYGAGLGGLGLDVGIGHPLPPGPILPPFPAPFIDPIFGVEDIIVHDDVDHNHDRHDDDDTNNDDNNNQNDDDANDDDLIDDVENTK